MNRSNRYSPLHSTAAAAERDKSNVRQIINICLFLTFSLLCAACVFIIWTIIYQNHVLVPPKIVKIPEAVVNRAAIYNHFMELAHRTANNRSELQASEEESYEMRPSRFGPYISEQNASSGFRLVCYFAVTSEADETVLETKDLEANLCTHLNIGPANILNNSIVIDGSLKTSLGQIGQLKKQNVNLKVLLWIGAAGIGDFSMMVENHANRKTFIRSLKATLENYRLDGVDLDWEFPNGFTKERMHFSQLLHEIRREYEREHRTYLLTLAVAAPATLVDVIYDVREINYYADWVNVMAYDFHFYSSVQPFTGLNAPLYRRHSEGAIFSQMNINYSITNWETKGLERSKIVVGLPTFGHTFKLVNPFNTKIGAPAEGNGSVGEVGFASYSEICWFQKNNLYVTVVYDLESCSPYMYAGTEWISFENEKSLECKTAYIKNNQLGGAMIFSLNTDDTLTLCDTPSRHKAISQERSKFPLVQKVHSTLFGG